MIALLIRIFLISVLFSFCSVGMAAYTPSVSFDTTKETYNIKQDGTYTLIYENVTKIETEKGVKEDGEVDITFNKTNDRVEIIEAFTLQPDGKRIQVPKSSIRLADDELSSGAPMFNDYKHKIIIFPDVKVGSRICYKYKLTAHKVPFEGHFLSPNFFTPHYVIRSHEINFNISDKLKLNVDLNGVAGAFIKHTLGVNHYKFSYEQKEAHKVEASQVELEDFGPYLIASTLNNQVEMGHEYQKKLVSKVKVTPKVKALANQITQGIEGEKQQIHALYNWVTKNIRYVAIYVGNGGFEPHTADSIISNRYGDCKDHAVLFESLLKAKGIESSAALINAGKAYTLPKYPVASPINHVITYLPTYDLYLDTTSEYTRFGYLPYQDMDKPTILTALSKIGHTPKMTSDYYATVTKVFMKIRPDGYIEGESLVLPKGANEDLYRQSRLSNRDKDDKQVIDNLLARYNETGEGKITSTDPLDLDVPIEVRSKFVLDPVSNMPGPAAMVIPVGAAPGDLYQIAKDKPDLVHDYPFACYPEKITEEYEIEFPNDVKITRVPEGKTYSKDNITYSSTYNVVAQVVHAKRSFAIEHESLSCRPDQQDITEDFFKFIKQDLRSQIFYE